MAEPGAGTCSQPSTAWNSLLKAGAQVAPPGAPSPLTHSSGSGSGSATLFSHPWGLPPVSEALHPKDKPPGLLLEQGGLGGCLPLWSSGTLRPKYGITSFLPTPWCGVGSQGFKEPGLKSKLRIGLVNMDKSLNLSKSQSPYL